jgi:hypothetical protein
MPVSSHNGIPMGRWMAEQLCCAEGSLCSLLCLCRGGDLIRYRIIAVANKSLQSFCLIAVVAVFR